MRTRLALGVAVAVPLAFAGAALAQGPSAGSPAAGQGSSGPPGSQGAADPAKPPTARTDALPRSFTPTPAPIETARSDTPRAVHRIRGAVTKIDEARGRVTLKTDRGEMEVRFPPGALQGLHEGDPVEVQLALRSSGRPSP